MEAGTSDGPTQNKKARAAKNGATGLGTAVLLAERPATDSS
jgi:hypothetical protein